RDFSGVKFPARIRQSYGGSPVLDLAVKAVQPNAAVSFEMPDAVRNASVRVAADKVADGGWVLGGGSHKSVLIEMQDHLVLVEAPLGDSRSVPVIEQARQLVPGKPLTWVINSHHHHDHAGGLRAAVAEGMGVITQAENVAYLQRGLKAANRIAPD